jgi:cyanophycin synthetase
MKLASIRALPGPNIYIHRPVLKARIELEHLTEKESTDFPGFTERLLHELPGLRDHHCAKGEPGGFVERLHGGTYFGHIVEHVTLELGCLAGAPAHFGRTVYAGAPGRYDMLIEYSNESVTRYLLPVAMDLVEAFVQGAPYSLREKLAEAQEIVSQTELGPSTKAIVDAAQRRGIPWFRLTEGSFVQLGYGAQRKHIMATQSDRTSIIAVEVACDKALTKKLLDDAGIPVPRGLLVRNREEAHAALRELQVPLAVKPLDGNQGKGVSLQVTTAEELAAAYDKAAVYSSKVIVEECLTGKDYRLVVVGGRLVAASERLPAHVIGDGVSTIATLIERENSNPQRGEGHEKPLTRISVDQAVLTCLRRVGLTLDGVPAAGRRIFLRETANLSTGGTARDVTDEVHPAVVRIGERAARIVGLDICGIDLITPDISQPLPPTGAGIVEVNAAPGIRMHHHPSEGKPRDVGAAVIDMLYPSGASGRIPIISITGTNGKTTVTRMIAHALQCTGAHVGMTTTDGISIDGHCVVEGDRTGFHSARAVLADPLVEIAVLETARGGIVRRSLGYDWSDIGVLTNIQPDHFGQDGIECLEDLIFVKSLVAERVRAGGTLVLNADDENLARLPDNPRVRKLPRHIIYFSLVRNNPVILAHRRSGRPAFFLDQGWLVEAVGDVETRVAHEKDIPVTLGGVAKFQIANVLAALAACRAQGMRAEDVVRALADFDSNGTNQGRMNLYRVNEGYVLVDYGHNPGAFQAIGDLVKAWPHRRITGIFTAPGDRSDDLIKEVARQAAHCFDRLIVREDDNLCGRQPGEVAEVISQVIRHEAPDKECRLVLQEAQALTMALRTMQQGEIIVFFYEKQTEPCLEILRRYGAEPAKFIDAAAGMQPVDTSAESRSWPMFIEVR